MDKRDRSLSNHCLLAVVLFLIGSYSVYSQVSSLSNVRSFVLNNIYFQEQDQYQQNFNFYNNPNHHVVPNPPIYTDIDDQPLSSVMAQQGLPEGFFQQTVTAIKSDTVTSHPSLVQANPGPQITNFPNSDVFRFNTTLWEKEDQRRPEAIKVDMNDHYWQKPLVQSTTAVPEGRKISMNNQFARQYPHGMLFHGSSSQRFTKTGVPIGSF